MAGDRRIYYIGLTFIKGIGDVLARHLISYFGDVEAVFSEKRRLLEKVSGIGEYTANLIEQSRKEAFLRAEKDLAFAEKNNIRIFTLE